MLKNIRVIVPLLYGGIIVIVALTKPSAVAAVAIVGGILVAIMFIVLAQSGGTRRGRESRLRR